MVTGTSLSLKLYARKRNERSAKLAKLRLETEPLEAQLTRKRSAVAKGKKAMMKPNASKLMLCSLLRSRKEHSNMQVVQL